jgi:hypothetical protein
LSVAVLRTSIEVDPVISFKERFTPLPLAVPEPLLAVHVPDKTENSTLVDGGVGVTALLPPPPPPQPPAMIKNPNIATSAKSIQFFFRITKTSSKNFPNQNAIRGAGRQRRGKIQVVNFFENFGGKRGAYAER